MNWSNGSVTQTWNTWRFNPTEHLQSNLNAFKSTVNNSKFNETTIAEYRIQSGQIWPMFVCYQKTKKAQLRISGFSGPLVRVDTSHLPWPTPSHGSFQGVQRLAPPAERVPSSIRRPSSLWAAPSQHPTRRRRSFWRLVEPEVFLVGKKQQSHQESQVGMVCVFLLGLGGFRMMILIGSLRSFKKWVSESQFSSF